METSKKIKLESIKQIYQNQIDFVQNWTDEEKKNVANYISTIIEFSFNEGYDFAKQERIRNDVVEIIPLLSAEQIEKGWKERLEKAVRDHENFSNNKENKQC